ncbi:hypothetical protein KCP74_12720 [Salmonella enterica subsp. enterica]|nr:hypothetical protein KCP74_12720 [Salmonella enterica subsp. enterica]
MPVLFHINPRRCCCLTVSGTLLYLFICKGAKFRPTSGSSALYFPGTALHICRWVMKWRWSGFIMCGDAVRWSLSSLKAHRLAGCDIPACGNGRNRCRHGLELAGVAAGMAGLLPAQRAVAGHETIIISMVTLAVTIVRLRTVSWFSRRSFRF